MYTFADFEQDIIKFSHFVDFEQVIIKISHFADFEQVIIKISHFVDFEQEQNFLGRNQMLRYFFWGHYPVSLPLHPSFSDPLGSPAALSSTPTLGFFNA